MNIYTLYNKKSKKVDVFGSIAALCKNTGLKTSPLYYYFGIQKNKKYENKEIRIEKDVVKRGGK